MSLRLLLIVFVAIGLFGCGEKETPQPAAVDETPAAQPEEAVAVTGIWDDEAFVEHMHEHADKLDDLNFALADGNLERARADAEWLANHDTNDDIQAEWMPFLYAMRTEAEAVLAAADIEAAQAAAERITVKCQECHAEAGVNARL